MKACIAILIAITAWFTFNPASASERQLYVEQSQQGESLDSFALRISKRALSVTKARYAEVCGEFVLNDGVYTITMMTAGTEHGCDVARPTDANRTGITFHTHPLNAGSNFYDGDYAMPGYVAHGRGGVKFQHGNGTMRKVQA